MNYLIFQTNVTVPFIDTNVYKEPFALLYGSSTMEPFGPELGSLVVMFGPREMRQQQLFDTFVP